MKKVFLIGIFALLPFLAFADVANVGIIQGIWFSDTQFFEGNTVRVYTAVQNNSGDDVEGVIEFFDNGESFGKRAFSTLNGRIIESWMDRVLSLGNHTFSVKITQILKDGVDEEATPLQAEFVSSDREVAVLLDSDGDFIADEEDTDDDNDGYSDEEEREAGTDPLDKNDFPQEEEEEVSSEQTTENTHNELSSEERELLIEQSPELIQELAEKNKLIETLSLQVSKLQNVGKGLIQRESERIKRIQEEEKTEDVQEQEQKESEGVSLEDDKVSEKRSEKGTWREKITVFYAWLLKILSWFFSLWWFVVVLIFVGIYLFLKILFRIFGGRSDYD